VVVHAIDCEALAAFDDLPDRWIDLHWTEGRHSPVHNVTVDVTMSNEKGVLGRICTLIGEQNANISDLHFMDRKPDFYRLLIDLDVRDAEHLHAVMMAVEADSDVAAVQRFPRLGSPSLIPGRWQQASWGPRSRERWKERLAWSSSGETHEVG
jgi:guanosine-3',5'-bis(diphosphate) 3'-pyrophosphohydrolase